MLNFPKVILLALLLSACGPTENKDVITKDQLIEMFDSMSQDSSWDYSKPMLWGYFFTDASKERLQAAKPFLESQGYRFVDIYLADKESSKDPDLWWLHVEKVEIHTPDSLNQRNIALYKFADDHGLESYDGMDVEPVNAKN